MADITVIVTAHRRPHTLSLLTDAIRHQTLAPGEIWFYANDPSTDVMDAMARAKADRVFSSSVNAHFHGRFALALTAPTDDVAIFDDDSIPGPRWFENCLATMERTPGILGAAGVRLHDNCYATATKHGWHEPRIATVAVDLVGHAWFLRTEWIHYLFAERAILGTNGEDIELAARVMRFAGIACYCPPHPPHDKSFWGSTRGQEFGDDAHASFRRAAHIAERDQIVQTEIAKGWRPLFMRGQSARAGATSRMAIDEDRVKIQETQAQKSEVRETEQRGTEPTAARRKMQDEDVQFSSDAAPVGSLVALVPQSAQRVLHIGDPQSTAYETLKHRQQLTVESIEPAELLAATATAGTETVEAQKAGDETARQSAQFDCILCETLDRFRESSRILEFLRKRLTPEGVLIVRVPNVRHHSIVEGLIEGRPPGRIREIAGSGNGHPRRLFTRREIEKLLFRGGFHVTELRVLPGPGHAQWTIDGRVGTVRVGPLHIAGMKADEAEEFYASGYLVAARPEPRRDYGLTSIIIVTHNQLEYTRQCVESIRERTDEPYELIFVDNSSTDGTVEYLKGLGSRKGEVNGNRLPAIGPLRVEVIANTECQQPHCSPAKWALLVKEILGPGCRVRGRFRRIPTGSFPFRRRERSSGTGPEPEKKRQPVLSSDS